MKKYLMTGLLVWIPLVITAWVISAIVNAMDGLLRILPDAWRPEMWLPLLHLPKTLPGLGLLFALLILLITGVLAANFLGRQLLLLWDKFLGHIPFVRTIYSSVKQVSDTLLSGSGNAFKTVVLIQYPCAGTWTIGFQTGQPAIEIKKHLDGDDEYVSVFVPTTPSPTNGFLLIVPKSQTKVLSITVDEALKYVVSMGVVTPKSTVVNLPNTVK
jgi:uncharacterized membrane protein